MAKTIKVVKCPQCGSVHKKELRENSYLCESCNAEYFIDNDDITIIHKIEDNTVSNTGITAQKKGLFIAFGALIFFILSINIFVNKKTSTDINNYTTTNEKSSQVILDDKSDLLCKTQDDRLLRVTIGIEESNNSKKIVVLFKDKSGKLLNKQELNFSVPKNVDSFPFRIKYFSNDKAYIVFNNKTIFEVFADKLEIQELKTNLPELASGIASADVIYDQDGFKILCFNGKTYYFYPLINRVLQPDNFKEELRKLKLNNPINKIRFITKEESSSNMGIIVKCWQTEQIGYPKDVPSDGFCQKGTIEGKKPIFIFSYLNLNKYERFVPDRIFFNLEILGYNDDLLIISFSSDVNSRSSRNIQALNPENGEIIWTFECSELDKHIPFSPNKALSNKEYTVIGGNFEFIALDNKTGKLIAKF